MRLPEQIETPRLILRSHIAEDLAPFQAFLADEAAVRHMAFTDEQKTPAGAKALMDWVIGSYATPEPVFALAIVERERGAYIGGCGMHPLEDGAGTEMYYTVTRARWGEGFASEASGALVAWAFDELKLPSLVAQMAEANTASIRVAGKLGFTLEGPVKHYGQPGLRYRKMNPAAV